MRTAIALFLSSLFVMIAGCATIPQYSQHAYGQTVDLKIDTLNLMDKASEDYSKSEKDVNDLMLRIEKIYEFENGIPDNEVITTMWEILESPDKELLGGFLKVWKESGVLTPAVIKVNKRHVSNAFDQIIQLESGKIKEADMSYFGSFTE